MSTTPLGYRVVENSGDFRATASPGPCNCGSDDCLGDLGHEWYGPTRATAEEAAADARDAAANAGQGGYPDAIRGAAQRGAPIPEEP